MPDLSHLWSTLRRLPRRLYRGTAPSGRAVILLGLVGLVVGQVAGYAEFLVVATLAGILLALALVIVLVPTRVRGRMELRPSHTIAGETGAGIMHATNLWPIPLNQPLVVVSIDARAGVEPIGVRMPVLRRGDEVSVEFEVPGLRRGVLTLGPAGTRRNDPLGFFVRQVAWAKPVELWVRPAMVAVESLGPGFVRDLEGVPSDVVSMSDLSFHALREYVRGDDLRHVHWRSSARTGALHVRQYHDTRRSHAALLVDDSAAGYADPEELELALSIVASVVVRVALDEFDLTFSCGDELISATPGEVLDACCVAEPTKRADDDLVRRAQGLAQAAPDASQLVLVTGSRTSIDTILEARRAFGEDIRFLAFRTTPGAADEPQLAPGVIGVPALDQLPALLAMHVQGAVL